MKRVLIAVIAFSFVACGSSKDEEPTVRKRRKKRKAQTEESAPVAQPAKRVEKDPVATPDEPADAAPDGPPDPAGVISSIAALRRPGVICFGWSDTRTAAVCHVRSWSRQGEVAYAIAFLEHVDEGFEYFSVDGSDHTKELKPTSVDDIDKEQIKAAKKRIREGGYVGWIPKDGVTIGANRKRTIATVKIERRREKSGPESFDETLAIQCDKRWVDIDLNEESFGGAGVGNPTIRAYMTPSPDRILLTVSLKWGMEGDYGGAEDAFLLDLKKICED